ncbi:hypothetical protein JB92DRAFT_3149460 [Gautieria morchelliformis]|nr:hypothetical protein JB92DRAFT_3149460 [Gautieria morchelliformis]
MVSYMTYHHHEAEHHSELQPLVLGLAMEEGPDDISQAKEQNHDPDSHSNEDILSVGSQGHDHTGWFEAMDEGEVDGVCPSNYEPSEHGSVELGGGLSSSIEQEHPFFSLQDDRSEPTSPGPVEEDPEEQEHQECQDNTLASSQAGTFSVCESLFQISTA